jgi:hypothetical protein
LDFFLSILGGLLTDLRPVCEVQDYSQHHIDEDKPDRKPKPKPLDSEFKGEGEDVGERYTDKNCNANHSD